MGPLVFGAPAAQTRIGPRPVARLARPMRFSIPRIGHFAAIHVFTLKEGSSRGRVSQLTRCQCLTAGSLLFGRCRNSPWAGKLLTAGQQQVRGQHLAGVSCDAAPWSGHPFRGLERRIIGHCEQQRHHRSGLCTARSARSLAGSLGWRLYEGLDIPILSQKRFFLARFLPNWRMAICRGMVRPPNRLTEQPYHRLTWEEKRRDWRWRLGKGAWKSRWAGAALDAAGVQAVRVELHHRARSPARARVGAPIPALHLRGLPPTIFWHRPDGDRGHRAKAARRPCRECGRSRPPSRRPRSPPG